MAVGDETADEAVRRNALFEFNRLPEDERRVEGPVLDIMDEIARTGRVRYPWSLVKPAVSTFVRDQIIAHARARFPRSSDPSFIAAKRRASFIAFAPLARFDDAPFTSQRLIEIVMKPERYYKCPDKLARALMKVMCVTGTVSDPDSSPRSPKRRKRADSESFSEPLLPGRAVTPWWRDASPEPVSPPLSPPRPKAPKTQMSAQLEGKTFVFDFGREFRKLAAINRTEPVFEFRGGRKRERARSPPTPPETCRSSIDIVG